MRCCAAWPMMPSPSCTLCSRLMRSPKRELKRCSKRCCAVVPQQDGEHLEVDDALQQLADALQQVVEVEDAGDLARDLVEHSQRLRLARDAGVEARVLDRDGHARGGEFQQALVFLGEVAALLGLEIDDADDAVLDDQRHRELGLHIGVGVDVVVDLCARPRPGWTGARPRPGRRCRGPA